MTLFPDHWNSIDGVITSIKRMRSGKPYHGGIYRCINWICHQCSVQCDVIIMDAVIIYIYICSNCGQYCTVSFFCGLISAVQSTRLDLVAMKKNNLDTDRSSHLNILVLSMAAEPTNEINAAVQCNYHCYRDTSFLSETERLTFNNL